MSSKGKMKAGSNTAGNRRAQAARQKQAENVARHSTFLFVFVAVGLVAVFIGRWFFAIGDGYFGSFVQVDAAAATAVGNMTGLTPSAAEKETLLPLQREWDLFTASRLRDEVTAEAYDGAKLHAYLYDEGSDVTVLVLPRFYQDGTADFLPGPYLNWMTGCNILLPDPRAHGESGGEYFTYGMKEQYDIAAWADWADENLGAQTLILWGEGTGANTILFAAANGLLPDSVAFAVAESSYASLREMARASIWKWYRVPSPFLSAVEWKLSRSGAGFTLGDIELAKALWEAPTDTPVLFLQSAGDTYILPGWSALVRDAYSGPMEFISGGGTHGTVYAAESAAIQETLTQWWRQYGAS